MEELSSDQLLCYKISLYKESNVVINPKLIKELIDEMECYKEYYSTQELIDSINSNLGSGYIKAAISNHNETEEHMNYIYKVFICILFLIFSSCVNFTIIVFT